VSDVTLDEHADALDSERKDRAVAMLGLPELIAGVQVEPLTPRRLEWLRAMGNPFVCGGGLSDFQIYKFMWHVSPKFVVETDAEKPIESSFLEAMVSLDIPDALEGIDEYLDRAFLDAGPGREGVSFYGSTAGLYCSLNTAYPGAGWHLERVLDTPLRILYQLIKAADDARGCTMQNRRSSPLISKFLSEIEHFELSIVKDFDAEMDAFVDAKCAQGYKLCSEPIQKINLAIPAACQQDAPWIVPMRKVS
jgi:hypothetical protein